jgi:hypothetical protein
MRPICLGVDHLVEGVVEGAQVGVDLLREGAGEVAELLAGLDGGRVRIRRLTCLAMRAWTATAMAR